MLSELVPFSSTVKRDKDVSRSAIIRTSRNQLIAFTGSLQENHFAQRTLEVETITEGEAGIELSQTIDTLGAMNGKVELNVPRYQSGTVKRGNTILPIRGSVDEILELEIPETGWSMVGQADTLTKAAAVADRCRRQDDDLQYDIDGICLQASENGIDLIGADLNQMIVVKTDAAAVLEGRIVCSPIVAKALSMMDRRDELYIKVEENCLWLKQGGKINVVPLLSGEIYPDYREVIDPRPRAVGLIDTDDTNRLVSLIRKEILKPTAQGLVRLRINNGELEVYGKHQEFKFTCNTGDGSLEPIAVSASGLTKLLALFDAPIEVKFSAQEEQLYLSQGRKFGILAVEEDFFR